MFAAVTPVTPSRTLSSVASAVTDANLLICAPFAVISVPPRVKLFVVTLPDTVTESLASVIKSASPVNPIDEPLIITLSTVTFPADMSPVVDIGLAPVSIDPKSDVMDPALSAPTVTIPVSPVFLAYVESTSADVALVFIWVCISLVNPDK